MLNDFRHKLNNSITLWTSLLIIVVISGGIYGLTSFEESNETDENLTQLKLGYVPAPLNSPHYTAKEEGFYRDNGLKVEFYEMSGPEIGKAVKNGRLDIGSSATTPAVYQARAGLPIRLVAARAGCTKDQGCNYLMVRDGVEIDSVEDFKGKTLCTETSGSMDELFLKIWADNNNISLEDDVKYTYTSEESWEAAFASGSVDACAVSEPGKTYLENKNLAHVYQPLKKSHYRTAFVAMRADMLKERPEVAKRFLKAYAEAAEYARDNPEERKKHVSNYTGISMDVLDQATVSQVPENLTVDTALMNNVQDDMYEYGLIQDTYNLEKMVDNSIIREVQENRR